MEFPARYINPLRKAGKLDDTLDALADIAIVRINGGRVDTMERFCQDYIRNASSLENEGQRLRTVVASLVFEYGVLRNSSAEIQWEIVCVYGPQNYKKTVSYLDSLPSFFHPKIKRLLLVCPPNKMAATILFNSSFIDIISHDWMVQLKAQSPEMYLVAHHYDVDDSVKQLRSLFPQLSINRAERLLKNFSVEQATQMLLDDEDAGKQREKKVFEPIQRSGKLTYTPDYEKTLQLANALLDDEMDDEPEDEGDPDIRVFDSQVGADEEDVKTNPAKEASNSLQEDPKPKQQHRRKPKDSTAKESAKPEGGSKSNQTKKPHNKGNSTREAKRRNKTNENIKTT